MAGSDSQKQLLTLIREFASEKSHIERSLTGLRKTIEDLRTQLEASNLGLEDLKRVKEKEEQAVKGLEVELAIADAAIQTAERGIAKVEDQISVVGSDIEELKKMDKKSRDEFIKEMMEKNAEIRKYHEIRSSIMPPRDHSSLHSTDNLDTRFYGAIKEKDEFDSVTIENKLADIASQMRVGKEQYQAEQSFYNQIQQELIDVEERLSLMEDIKQTMKELEELGRQTAEVEEACASLGEQLQQNSECPSCHADNLEAFQELLQ